MCPVETLPVLVAGASAVAAAAWTVTGDELEWTSPSSRRIHRAPFALAAKGTVLVNLAEFDGLRSLEAFLDNALTEKGAVFIGVEITLAEAREVLDRIGEN